MANPDTDKIVDAIPLFELEETANMKDADGDGPTHSAGPEKAKGESVKTVADSEHSEGKWPDTKEKKQGDTNKVKFRHAFQLRTKLEGYNSGRQYIVQARTEEERQKIVADLTKLSKIAIDKFLAKSQFRKTQACPASLRPPPASVQRTSSSRACSRAGGAMLHLRRPCSWTRTDSPPPFYPPPPPFPLSLSSSLPSSRSLPLPLPYAYEAAAAARPKCRRPSPRRRPPRGRARTRQGPQ